MSEEVGQLRASFTIDLSPLRRGLRTASGMLSKWAKSNDSKTQGRVGLDLTQLNRGLKVATANLNKWEQGARAQAAVTADNTPLQTKLASASRSLADFDRKRATASVDANVTPARRTLAEFRGTLANLRESDTAVPIAADVQQARRDVQEFVSWARQQRVEMTVSAVTTEAQRAAEIAKTYIDSLTARIDVEANSAAAIAEGRLAAGRINQMNPQFDVGAQTQGAMGDVQGVVRRTNAMRGNFDVGANTQPAESELAGFNQTIRRYSRSWGQQGIRARVQADTKQAQAQLRNLERIVQGTTGTERIRIEAETARAQGQLRGLQRIATGLGMQDPTVSVGVRGVAASTAQMLGLWKLADRLDGYNVQFKASVDDTLSRALPNMLGALSQQLARFKTVATAAAAAAEPIFYSALGMLPGALSAAGVAAGSLATRLGAGLVGAMGSVGSAAALGGAALGAYGYTMRRTLSYAFNLSSMLGDQKSRIDDAADAVKVAKAAVASATPGTQEYTNAVRGLAFAEQNAAFETRKMNAMMGYATPNMLKLNAAANDISIEFIKLGSAASDATAPMLTRWIRGLTGVMQDSRGAIVGMITDMNRVAGAFVRTMSKGREFANLSNIFSGIRQAGVPAMQILTSAIRLFVNTFAATVPAGLKVLNMLSRVTMAAARWSGTAAGQSKIRTVWQSLAQAGAQLWRIARDLGIALGGVIVALNATGIGQSMMNGLEGIAAGFRNVMREGGRGRAAIVEFGTYTSPVLSAIADLVKGVARQFGLMAMEVGKSGLMVDMVNALNDALLGTKDGQGIIKLLRHEFEVIGPLLPPLITALGNWFSVFAQAEPEMIFFIKTFTNILEAFNSLPEPVKRATARIIAWTTALNALGAGALVTLGTSMFQTKMQLMVLNAAMGTNITIWGTFKAAVLSTVGGLKAAAVATWGFIRAQTAAAIASTRAGVAAAASAIKVRLLSVATRAAAVGMRMMGVAATFMLGPWGLVIAGVVALGVALVVAYRRSETFRNAVNALGNFIKTTAVAAFRGLVNAARAVWQWFTRLPKPLQLLISPLGALIANFGRVKAALGTAAVAVGRFIGRLAVGTVRVFGTVLRVLWNAAKPVVTWLGQAAMAVGRFIARLAAQRVRQYGAVLGFLWNAAKPVVQWLGRAAMAVGRFVARLVVARVRQYGAVLRFLWSMAKPVVQWLGRAAMAVGKFIARLVVARVRQYGAVLRFLWQMAKPVIQWLGRAAVAVGKFVARLAVGAVRVFGRVLGAIWKAAQPVVNWIGRAAGAVGRFIGRLAVGAVRLFGRVIGAIWRAAKPVVTWLGKAALAAGRFITRLDGLAGVRLFGRLLKTLWNAAKPVVQWLGRAAVSVGKFLARLAVKGLRLFVNGLRAIWNGARTLIRWIGDAANAVGRFVNRGRESAANLRGVWNKFWSGLRNLWNRSLTAIGNRLERWRDAFRATVERIASWVRNRWNSFWSGLRNLWDRSWTAIGNRTESWRNAFRALIDRIAKWVRSRWDAFWSGLRNLWDRSWTAIGNRTESWRDAFRALVDRIAKWVRDRWNSFWSGLRGLWDRSWTAIGNRTESWRDALRNLMDRIAKWVRDRWESFWSGLRSLWDRSLTAVGDRLRSWRDAVRNLFSNIVDAAKTFGSNFAKAIGNGVKSGVNRAIEFFNGLGNAIEKLAGFIKLDISVPNIPKLARGGVTEYARGGVEKGSGQVTNGVTAIAGEAGRESIVPHTRWTPEGQRAYDAVPSIYRDRSHRAGRHDKSAVPPMANKSVSSAPPRGSHSHANDQLPESVLKKKSKGTRGAHVDMSRRHKNVYDYIKKRADDVVSNVGGITWETYHHHITAPGANEHSSVDFWAPGGAGSAIGKSKGDQTARYVANNHAAGNLGTIWHGKVSTGGPFRPFGGAFHPDHVHVGWSTNPDAKIVKGGGVGGFFSGVMDSLGNAYNSVKDFIAKRWNPPAVPNFSAQGKFGEVLGGASRKLLSGAKDWVTKKAEEMLSFGSDSSSGGPGLGFEGKNNRDLGKKMNEAMGWGNQWGALDKLWTKESGWSHTAQNPTSSAYGIPQAMVSAHNMPKGYGPPGGDPKVQIDWGLGYIKGRYGDPNAAWGHSQRVGWYEKGGVVPGFRPMPAVLHGGERVLPRDLNTGFESLSRSIDSWNSRGASAPSVDVASNHRDLAEQNQLLRENNELLRRIYREHPDAIGGRVYEGNKHNHEHDRETRESVSRGAQKKSRENMTGRPIGGR